MTALISAVSDDDFNLFQKLVDEGASINDSIIESGERFTPYNIALVNTDQKIALCIASQNKFDVNWNTNNHRLTPLMLAITSEKQAVARRLAQRADINFSLRCRQRLNAADYLRIGGLEITWLFDQDDPKLEEFKRATQPPLETKFCCTIL